MVVMPAFPVTDQSHEPVVAAIVVRVKAAIAPEMRDRVDRPGNVPDRHRTHEHAPNQPAETELHGAPQGPGAQRADQDPGAQEGRPLGALEGPPYRGPLQPLVET